MWCGVIVPLLALVAFAAARSSLVRYFSWLIVVEIDNVKSGSLLVCSRMTISSVRMRAIFPMVSSLQDELD